MQRVNLWSSAEKHINAARAAAGQGQSNWKDLSRDTMTSEAGVRVRDPDVPLAPFVIAATGEGFRVSNGQFMKASVSFGSGAGAPGSAPISAAGGMMPAATMMLSQPMQGLPPGSQYVSNGGQVSTVVSLHAQ